MFRYFEFINLKKSNCIIDLGIYFEFDLSFKMNHKFIINKTYKMLDLMNLNTKDFRNPFCSKNLYTFLVRSNIAFGLLWKKTR